MKVTQTYYMKDADGEYFVAQPQPTLREMEPGDVDDTMSVAERAVRIVLAKAKGVCLSKVHAIDHAGNSYLREASATQCANAIGALNIQPLIDQVKGILSLPTQPEPPADVARDAEPVAYVTGVYGGHTTVAPIDAAQVLRVGMALYTAPPAPDQSEQHLGMVPADVARDAERWQMLPAFLAEFQVPYLQLVDKIDAAIEREILGGGND